MFPSHDTPFWRASEVDIYYSCLIGVRNLYTLVYKYTLQELQLMKLVNFSTQQVKVPKIFSQIAGN